MVGSRVSQACARVLNFLVNNARLSAWERLNWVVP